MHAVHSSGIELVVDCQHHGLKSLLAAGIMSGTASFLALEGLHVFITGAAGGIGSQAVREFLCEYESTSPLLERVLIHLLPKPKAARLQLTTANPLIALLRPPMTPST